MSLAIRPKFGAVFGARKWGYRPKIKQNLRFQGLKSRKMVPAERIELPTFGLQNRCTTAVLRRRRWLVGQKAADEIFSSAAMS